MRRRLTNRLVLTLAASAACSVSALDTYGQPVSNVTPAGWTAITTRMGIGADAEVRKDELNPANPGMGDFTLLGSNRGTQAELATRKLQTTGNPTTDRGSLMFMKFDISPTTTGTDNLAWGVNAIFSLAYANTNIRELRWHGPSPATGQDVLMKFDVFGLNPAYDHDSASWDYNWAESGANGPTYYNGKTPGIVPDSTSLLTLPAAPVIGRPQDDIVPSALLKLGEFTFQDIANPATLPTGASQELRTGSRILFQSPELNSLIQQAAALGKTSVSLMVMHGLDGFRAGTEEDPGTTPIDMLNHNYVFGSKNLASIPTNAGGASTPKPGPTWATTNAQGQFDPALIYIANTEPPTPEVPEPTTLMLVGLGTLAVVGATGRRR